LGHSQTTIKQGVVDGRDINAPKIRIFVLRLDALGASSRSTFDNDNHQN